MRARRLAVFAAACVLAGGCGDAPHHAAEKRASTPAPRDGALRCAGRGEPTVVLVSGLGVEPDATWSGVAPALRRDHRVCLFARPGLGGVAAVQPPLTAADAAAGLEQLARAQLGRRARVVLVGASFGGLVTQLYAARERDGVAGMVLVDSLHPDLDATFARLFGERAARARAAALARNPEGITFAGLRASARQAAAIRSLGDLPLIALVHGVSFEPGGEPAPHLERAWRRMQRDLAALSTRGEARVVPGTHHRIAEDDPDAVLRAIQDVAAR
jgi:pimeloyl-ACP methyl ester carboxylesterase